MISGVTAEHFAEQGSGAPLILYRGRQIDVQAGQDG